MNARACQRQVPVLLPVPAAQLLGVKCEGLGQVKCVPVSGDGISSNLLVA